MLWGLCKRQVEFRCLRRLADGDKTIMNNGSDPDSQLRQNKARKLPYCQMTLGMYAGFCQSVSDKRSTELRSGATSAQAFRSASKLVPAIVGLRTVLMAHLECEEIPVRCRASGSLPPRSLPIIASWSFEGGATSVAPGSPSGQNCPAVLALPALAAGGHSSWMWVASEGMSKSAAASANGFKASDRTLASTCGAVWSSSRRIPDAERKDTGEPFMRMIGKCLGSTSGSSALQQWRKFSTRPCNRAGCRRSALLEVGVVSTLPSKSVQARQATSKLTKFTKAKPRLHGFLPSHGTDTIEMCSRVTWHSKAFNRSFDVNFRGRFFTMTENSRGPE